MCKSKRKIIESFWSDLSGAPFDIHKLSERIIFDCGVDATGLAVDDLAAVFHGKYEKSWHDIAFAFNEVLTQYSSEKLSNSQFVQAVFVSLFLAEAVNHGEGDLWYSFDKILRIVCRNREKIDSDYLMVFFAELLRDVSVDHGLSDLG